MSREDEIGKQLDQFLPNYDLDGYLAQGGAGLIYIFNHNRLSGIQVAIKIVKPELTEIENFRKYFKREITSLAKCKHPNVIRIYDTGESNITADGNSYEKVPFYVMDYLDGYKELYGHLEDNLDNIARDDIQRIFRQILDGVQHIHENGIFHNDLKGPNIFVGSTNSVVIADFGFAKSLSDITTVKTVALALLSTSTLRFMKLVVAMNLLKIPVKLCS